MDECQKKLGRYVAMVQRDSPKVHVSKAQLKEAREESSAALETLREHMRKHGCL